MMKPVVDFAKQIVSLANDMRQSKADIKELEQGQKEIRQELRDMTTGGSTSDVRDAAQSR